MLLTDRGIDAQVIQLATTSTGKPYCVSRSSFAMRDRTDIKLQDTPQLSPPISFNISHDASYVVMTFEDGSEKDGIGIDIMRARLPNGENITNFASVLSDQVSS